MSCPVDHNDEQVYYAVESIKDNQVLQRCAMTNTATVCFEDGSRHAYKTGGPYNIHKASNVYVGDIWIMAGQSNMRGHGYQVDPYTNRSLIEQGQPGIQLYNSKEEWTMAKEPLHQLYLSKRTVHHTLPDPTVKNPKLLEYRGASLGLSFAKQYQQETPNVPVGLVASAHGGTSLNDWKRPDTLNDDTEDKTLYGAMMARIKAVGGCIAGILWYQGESDTNAATDASTYKERFRLWMQTVRQDVGNATLPIAFVQIGPHAIDVEETKKNWELVQLAQFDLMTEEEGYTAGVASIDCSLDDRLHLSAAGLKTVGKRLAIVASKLLSSSQETVSLPKYTFCAQYQDPITPDVKGKIAPCILLTVNQAWLTEGLVEGSEVPGFGLCCEDKTVAIIHARVVKGGSHIGIWISHKPKPELFLTYGLTYPLIDSSNKGWPAFSIKVKL